MKYLIFTLFILFQLVFYGCTGKKIPDTGLSEPMEFDKDAVKADERDQKLKELASQIAESLDDKQLTAQVIITGIDGRGQLSQSMKTLLEECPAGGIMLFRYNLDTNNDEIKTLIAEAEKIIFETSIQPFVAVDHEGGFVNRFRPGVADLPPAVFYWEKAQESGWETTIAQIFSDSLNSGKAIGSLGINLNFAPVAEYLHKDNSDFLDDRVYGPEAAFTAKASAAFIMGMTQSNILCAVKHFPGSAGSDPHFYPSVLTNDLESLAELTAPFAVLVREGHARAIMVSHTKVPAWDNEKIASLSPVIMENRLRQDLGFDGIIICDDFLMAASELQDNSRPETAAVQAISAGADMILVWPMDLRRTHQELQSALTDGRLSRERLRDAAERIVYEKINIGIIE